MANKKAQSPLRTPKGTRTAAKADRALDIRKSSAKARQGKPLAFPSGRIRP